MSGDRRGDVSPSLCHPLAPPIRASPAHREQPDPKPRLAATPSKRSPPCLGHTSFTPLSQGAAEPNPKLLVPLGQPLRYVGDQSWGQCSRAPTASHSPSCPPTAPPHQTCLAPCPGSALSVLVTPALCSVPKVPTTIQGSPPSRLLLSLLPARLRDGTSLSSGPPCPSQPPLPPSSTARIGAWLGRDPPPCPCPQGSRMCPSPGAGDYPTLTFDVPAFLPDLVNEPLWGGREVSGHWPSPSQVPSTQPSQGVKAGDLWEGRSPMERGTWPRAAFAPQLPPRVRIAVLAPGQRPGRVTAEKNPWRVGGCGGILDPRAVPRVRSSMISLTLGFSVVLFLGFLAGGGGA